MIKEKTFVILKPDTIHRSLIGDIIQRIEKIGLKFVAMKMLIPSREQIVKHYNKSDEWCESKGNLAIKNLKDAGKEPEKSALEYGKGILEGNFSFMTSSPVVIMIIEGNQAVGIVKKIVGGTEPLSSDVGTIRGDLTLDSYALANRDNRAVRNLIHCSDAPEEAEREIKVWFKKDEIVSYKHVSERMLYDVNLDGILE
ncbi:MAG: nucleoside-diphosphate kinase [Patescibacteria group bacterium]